jgi:hypothetical protein
VRQQALLHVPTRAIFHVYRVLSGPLGPPVGAPGYDEASMRARLIHVHDGFPVPPPDETNQFGRAAIRWFLDFGKQTPL